MKKKISLNLTKGIVFVFLWMISLTMFAQELTVRGSVKDMKGEPLIGVTVRIEGTTIGTITDLDGFFILSNVPGDATLDISYVGMKTQRIPVNGRTAIDVVMEEEPEMLEEVVVVGYGTQKKSDITGSVTSVPKDRFSKLPVTNVLQAIQGVAAGINVTQSSSIPGDAPSIMVRGRNSINASSEPYIVVDGVPLSKTDGSLNDINPNDIESMEILKDASATAIYGTNGANGVILITTKRGSTGKPVIRYNGYGGVEGMAHVLEPGSPEQVLERYAEYARIQGASLYQGGPIRYEYEAENYANGKTVDWIDLVTQTGNIQDHNLSISGGRENVK